MAKSHAAIGNYSAHHLPLRQYALAASMSAGCADGSPGLIPPAVTGLRTAAFKTPENDPGTGLSCRTRSLHAKEEQDDRVCYRQRLRVLCAESEYQQYVWSKQCVHGEDSKGNGEDVRVHHDVGEVETHPSAISAT